VWHKMTKGELIQAIKELEKVAQDNKALAERSVEQALEWKKLYEQSSTDPESHQVSIQTH